MTTEKKSIIKSITMKGEVLELLSTYNASIGAETIEAKDKGAKALASAEEKIKDLNKQIDKEFVEGFSGEDDPVYEALKEGYYMTYRIKQDKDTGKAKLDTRDTIVQLPALFDSIGKKDAFAWKARIENFTFRMAARANKEVGAIDSKKFAQLYKLSDEAKCKGEKDPISNRALRVALQEIVDTVCNHPDENGMNAFKFDERYIKYLLLTVFKAGKGRGCTIAIPNANTMAKFITICLYSLINGLDFKVECKKLDADSPKDKDEKTGK